jgi:phospholipase/carboxylesterase
VPRGGRQEPGGRADDDGRLRARPSPRVGAAPIGLHALGLDPGRDGLLYVPAGASADRPTPLVLMLHGAGGNAGLVLPSLRALADAVGLILLVPDSRRRTWDVLLGGYGPDVAFIDRALAQVFDRYAVEPTRIAIGGFSDGASYALSLGLTNGDLFTHVMAFSPGFLAPAAQRGWPRLFIAHGQRDDVLPIESCSRRIVPPLRRAEYDVCYREFDGPHTVPDEIALEAVDWFTTNRGC